MSELALEKSVFPFFVFLDYVFFFLFLELLWSFMSLSQVFSNRFQKNSETCQVVRATKKKKGVFFGRRGGKEARRGLAG